MQQPFMLFSKRWIFTLGIIASLFASQAAPKDVSPAASRHSGLQAFIPQSLGKNVAVQLQTINANGTLSGTVTSGISPVSGATVTAVLALNANAISTATTDGTGAYSMDLAAGTYNTAATLHGYNTAVANGLIITSGAVTTQNYVINSVPAVVLSGTVTDGSGRGSPMAAQILIDSPGFSTSLYTNALDGTYSISLYQQTDYTFAIVPLLPGYLTKTMAVKLTSTPVTRNFTMEVDQISCKASGYRPAYTYFQDFESTNGGFVPSGSVSTWVWGTPLVGPAAAYSGINLWATNLNGSYNNNEASQITSPAINLSGLAGKSIYVQWWQWISIETGHDHVYVNASNNGGASWTQIYNTTGSSPTWKRAQVTLDASYAVANFEIQFQMVSDATNNFSGFYLDDLGIGGAAAVNESFEGSSFPPPSWGSANLDFGGTTWQTSTMQAHSAVHLASSAGGQDGWLITPDVTISSSSSSFTFWEYTANSAAYSGHFGWMCNEASLGGCGSPPINYMRLNEWSAPTAAWRQQSTPINGLQGATLRFAE